MRWTSLATSVAMTAAVMAATTAPAHAAAPANDDISAAIPITAVPTTLEADTSEATVAADDPTDCVGPRATVWYALTVPTATRVQLDTIGSDYDTTLSVFTGNPGALSPIACNDDRVELASGVRFDAEASTTYLVMAGTCCFGEPGEVGPGGHLVLNVSEAAPPIEATLTIDRRATVTSAGVLTVTGTATCTQPADFTDGLVVAVQRHGRFEARGDGFAAPTCAAEPTRWRVETSSFTGILFGPSRARVTVTLFASDGFDFVEEAVSA
ncbi:MAG: hypothetical protein ACRDV2_10705, partial [Actinomycetes bacterium]